MDSYTLANILPKPPTASSVNPQRLAVTFRGRSYTYEELEERSNRLASGLLDAGFQHGDRVCVLLYNRVEWIELFFALAKIGGVMVPINYYLKPAEIGYITEDAGARWLVTEESLLGVAEAVRERVDRPLEGVIVGAGPGSWREYEALLAAGSPTGFDPKVEIGDLFLLQYTSGTTGFPKGAMHTHSTVLWNTFTQIHDFAVTAEDVYLVVPALCWAAGFHDLALATLWVGGRIILQESTGFDAEKFFDTVQRERVTKVLLVPSVLKQVLASPAFDQYDLSSVRLVLSGGEPVPVTAIEEMTKRLPGCTLVQGYGLSEFPTLMTYLPIEHAIAKKGSAGRACRIAEVRIVDVDGRDAAPREIGQIICRSPASMIGYYGNEPATAAALDNGWLHTGDLGYTDEEGFIYIAGRSKDMIITGGLNVYPAEVERVIAQHPAVVEAAVIGVPDERWGEIGKAFVVVNPDVELSQEGLEEHLRAELANYKIPRLYEFRSDPLPRTTSGKVQKFLLGEA